MKQIKHWPSEDQPREKLRNKGAGQLTETELLTILIQNGTK
jgi:DNA repair protein RadC